MLLLLYLPAICGLAIVSKINFEDTDKLRHDKKDVDAFLIEIQRRNNTADTQRISRRKTELPKIRKGKITTTERRVPVIRGAASSKELVAIYDVEDLHPPRPGATDDWYLSQSVESSTRYPDSKDYFPNVGPYPPPTTSPRPVYGVPSTGRPSSWCPSGQGGQNGGGGSWGQGNNNGGWGEGNGGYRPGQGGYPSGNGGGSWGQGGYPTSNGGGQSGHGQGGYPPSNSGGSWGQGGQGQGGYPPSNSGGGWGQSGHGQGGYPPSNSGGSWGQGGQGQGGYPPSNSGGSWGQGGQGQGGYPPSNSGGGWGQNEGYPHGQGADWTKSSTQRQGKWVPCQPYDLSDNKNRRSGATGRGCPTEFDRDEFIPPRAPPTNKVHNKIASAELPEDVEEIVP